MVLAVFMIIFGAFALFSAPAAFLLRSLAKDPVSRRIQEVTWSGGYGVWMMIALAIGVVLAFLEIASGIGLLKLKPWARLTSVAYAATSIGLIVIGQVMTFVFLFPVLDELAQEYAGNTVAQAGVMGGKIGGTVGGLFGLVFPIIVLIAVTRPSIKDQLKAA